MFASKTQKPPKRLSPLAHIFKHMDNINEIKRRKFIPPNLVSRLRPPIETEDINSIGDLDSRFDTITWSRIPQPIKNKDIKIKTPPISGPRQKIKFKRQLPSRICSTVSKCIAEWDDDIKSCGYPDLTDSGQAQEKFDHIVIFPEEGPVLKAEITIITRSDSCPFDEQLADLESDISVISDDSSTTSEDNEDCGNSISYRSSEDSHTSFSPGEKDLLANFRFRPIYPDSDSSSAKPLLCASDSDSSSDSSESSDLSKEPNGFMFPRPDVIPELILSGYFPENEHTPTCLDRLLRRKPPNTPIENISRYPPHLQTFAVFVETFVNGPGPFMLTEFKDVNIAMFIAAWKWICIREGFLKYNFLPNSVAPVLQLTLGKKWIKIVVNPYERNSGLSEISELGSHDLFVFVENLFPTLPYDHIGTARLASQLHDACSILCPTWYLSLVRKSRFLIVKHIMRMYLKYEAESFSGKLITLAHYVCRQHPDNFVSLNFSVGDFFGPSRLFEPDYDPDDTMKISCQATPLDEPDLNEEELDGKAPLVETVDEDDTTRVSKLSSEESLKEGPKEISDPEVPDDKPIYNHHTNKYEGLNEVTRKISDFVNSIVELPEAPEIAYQTVSNSILALTAYNSEVVWVKVMTMFGMAFNLSLSEKLVLKTIRNVSQFLFGTDNPLLAASLVNDMEENVNRENFIKLMSTILVPFATQTNVPDVLYSHLLETAPSNVGWGSSMEMVTGSVAYIKHVVNHFEQTGSLAAMFSREASVKYILQLMIPIKYALALYTADRKTEIDPKLVMSDVTRVVQYGLSVLESETDRRITGEIYKNMDAAIKFAMDMKVIIYGTEPVVIPYSQGFYGSSGVGKTTIQTQAAYIIGALMLGRPVRLDEMQSFVGDEKFDVLQTHTKVAILDDYANSLIKPGTSNGQDILIRLLSNAPKTLNKARLEEKDRMFSSLVALMLSTNHYLLQADQKSTCPVSLIRRILTMWDVSVRKEYRKPNSQMLDPNKVPKDMDIIQDIWQCTGFEALTDPDPDGNYAMKESNTPTVMQPEWSLRIKRDARGAPMENWTFKQMVQYWKVDVLKHKQAQEYVSQFLIQAANKRFDVSDMKWLKPKVPEKPVANLPPVKYVGESGVVFEHPRFNPTLTRFKNWVYRRLTRGFFKSHSGHTEFRLHEETRGQDFLLEMFGVDTDTVYLRERFIFALSVLVTAIGNSKFLHPITWMDDAVYDDKTALCILTTTNSNTFFDRAVFNIIKDICKEVFLGCLALLVSGVLAPLVYLSQFLFGLIPKLGYFKWTMPRVRIASIVVLIFIAALIPFTPILFSTWLWSHTVAPTIYIMWPIYIATCCILRASTIFSEVNNEQQEALKFIQDAREATRWIRQSRSGLTGFGGLTLISGAVAVSVYKDYEADKENSNVLTIYGQAQPENYNHLFSRKFSTGSTPQELFNIICNNILRSFSDPNLTFLAVTPNLWVTVAHCISRKTKCKMTVTRGSNKSMQTNTVTYNPHKVYRPDPQADILFIYIEERLPVADISHLFREFEPEVDTVVSVAHKPEANVISVATGRTLGATILHGEGLTSNGLAYQASLYNGACGSPVYVNGRKSKIVGIHVGANKENGCTRSAAVLVNNRHITSAFTHFGIMPTNTPLISTLEFNTKPSRKASPYNHTLKGGKFGPGIKYVGTLDKTSHHKSVARRTGISDQLVKLGFPDTHGDQYKGRKWWEAYESLIAGMSSDNPDMPEDLVRRSIDDFLQPFFPSYTKTPFTIGEAVNGKQGSFACQGLKMDSGGCILYPGQRTGIFEDGPKGKMSPPELLRDIKKHENEKRNQMESFVPSQGLPKLDEVLLVDESGKVKLPRVIAASCLVSLINHIRYLGPLFDVLISNRWISETAVGLDMYSEMDDVYNFVTNEGKWRPMFMDVSKFDRTIPTNIKHAVASILYTLATRCDYTDDQLAITKGILREFVNPLIVVSGDIFRLMVGICSGTFGTSFLDGLVMSIYKRVFFFSVYPNLNNYRQHVRLLTYGDDSAEGVRTGLFGIPILPHYNAKAQADFFAKYGIKLTSAFKSEMLGPWPSKWMFLARGCTTLKTPYGPTKIGPIREESLFKRLYWQVDSPMSDEEHYVAVVPILMVELALHGRKYYNKYQALLKKVHWPVEIDELHHSYDDTIKYYINNLSKYSKPVTYITVQAKEERERGVVSKVSSAIAQATGLLAQIPIIKFPMTAANVVATSVTNIADHFGYSRPTNVHPPQRVVGTNQNLNVTNVVDTSHRIALDALCERPVYTGAGGPDPLAFATFIQKEVIIGKRRWLRAHAVGFPLRYIDVEPIHHELVTPDDHVAVSSPKGYIFNPMGEAALCFNHWTGTLIYRFKVIGPINMGGILQITYDPVYPDPTAPLESTTSYLLDLSKEREVEIAVKPAQSSVVMEHSFSTGSVVNGITAYELPTPRRAKSSGSLGEYYEPATNGYPTGTIDLPKVGNGYILLKVYTRLRGAFARPEDEVTVVWSLRGSDDVQFFDPNPIIGQTTMMRYEGEAAPWKKKANPSSTINTKIRILTVSVLSLSLGIAYYWLPISWMRKILTWTRYQVDKILTDTNTDESSIQTPSIPASKKNDDILENFIPEHLDIKCESGEDDPNTGSLIGDLGPDDMAEQTHRPLDEEHRTDPSVHYGKFLEREVLLENVDVPLNNTISRTWDPWKTLLTTETLRSRLKHTHGFRSDIEIRLRTTTSPYLYGLFALTYVPHLNDSFQLSKWINSNVAEYTRDLACTKLEHVFVELGQTTDVILKGNFLYHKDFVDLTTDDITELGRVELTTIVPPTYAGEDPDNETIHLNITVRFVNTSFMGTTSADLYTPQAHDINVGSVPRTTALFKSGESVVSFNTLVKRASPYITTRFSAGTVERFLGSVTVSACPYFRGRHHGAEFVLHTTFATYVRAMFVAFRSSFRLHYFATEGGTIHTMVRSNPGNYDVTATAEGTSIPTYEIEEVNQDLGLTVYPVNAYTTRATSGAQPSEGFSSVDIPHQSVNNFEIGRPNLSHSHKTVTFMTPLRTGNCEDIIYLGAGDDFTVAGYVGLPPVVFRHFGELGDAVNGL